MKKMRMTKKFGSFYMKKRFYGVEVRYNYYVYLASNLGKINLNG